MKHFPLLFQDNNVLKITDKLDIANTFHDFFVNVSKTLTDRLMNN